MTIPGRRWDPTALIEIKRKHLSDRPFKYAAVNDIPLFVVDMSPDDSAQPRLRRNERMEFVRWPDLSVFPTTRVRFPELPSGRNASGLWDR